MTPFVMLLCVALLAVLALVVDGGRALSARETALGDAEQAARVGAAQLSVASMHAGLTNFQAADRDRSRRAVHGRHRASRLCGNRRYFRRRDSEDLRTSHSSARARRDQRHRGVCLGRRHGRRRLGHASAPGSGPYQPLQVPVCLTNLSFDMMGSNRDIAGTVLVAESPS